VATTDPNAADRSGQQLEPPDPAQEFGAAAAADAELADRIAEDDDGERAEAKFAQQSQGPVGTEKAQPRDDG
jgi:hypothetical protein